MDGIDPALRLLTICRKNDLELSSDQQTKISHYVGALLEWNKKINLISRRDEENIWFSHILHSLSPLFYIDIAEGAYLLDLGSGGGLPGIPLAIARPDLHVTLLDSIKKKAMAAEDMVGNLGLRNVRVRTIRAEDFPHERRGANSFDLVIARAVAPLADLITWSRPLVKRVARQTAPGGEKTKRGRRVPATRLVALKGGDLDGEIAEARVKAGTSAITVIEMAFEGSLELGLEDKKLVLVNL